MKFLKTVKGKVAAGAATVIIVSGGTFAFANTDAGQSLKLWYDGLFKKTAQATLDEGQAYGDSLVPGLEKEYASEKSRGDNAINARESYLSKDRKDKISSAKDEHLKSLDNEKKAIMDGMQRQFYDIFVQGVTDIEKNKAKAKKYVEDDLPGYFENTGTDAKQRLSDNLNLAKDEAVSELEEAIKKAREEVEKGLDKNKNMIVDNLKTQTNHAVEDLRRTVSKLVKDNYEKQQKILETTADGLVDQAKIELDDVVSNMNN